MKGTSSFVSLVALRRHHFTFEYIPTVLSINQSSANALVRSSICDFLRFSCTKKSARVHFVTSLNGLLIIGGESFISGIQVYLYDVKNYLQQSWLFSYGGLISVYNLHFVYSSASL